MSRVQNTHSKIKQKCYFRAKKVLSHSLNHLNLLLLEPWHLELGNMISLTLTPPFHYKFISLIIYR